MAHRDDAPSPLARIRREAHAAHLAMREPPPQPLRTPENLVLEDRPDWKTALVGTIASFAGIHMPYGTPLEAHFLNYCSRGISRKPWYSDPCGVPTGQFDHRIDLHHRVLGDLEGAAWRWGRAEITTSWTTTIRCPSDVAGIE